jgi:hypothetical protein
LYKQLGQTARQSFFIIQETSQIIAPLYWISDILI